MKSKRVILTYTVAECGEYHSLEKYYEGIQTLEEAVELYLQMPTERMHGIPAIGINLHVEGAKRIQDSQVDIFSGDEIDVGMIRLMPEFCGNPQVLEALNAIIKRFPEKEVIDY